MAVHGELVFVPYPTGHSVMGPLYSDTQAQIAYPPSHWKRVLSPHRAGIVVNDLIELVEHAVGEREPRLLPDEGFFTYHRYLLLKYGALMLVQNAERYTLPKFKRLLECLNAVFRIILSLDPVTSLSVPIVRIHPVKGNARLEDIN